MRRNARVDDNQARIVETLRAAGASVQSLAPIGKGCPDILVGFRGVNYALEIKDGAKIPSKRRLTPDEQRWHNAWVGQVATIEDEQEALAVIGAVSPMPGPSQADLELLP